jgi:hypothetical protein
MPSFCKTLTYVEAVIGAVIEVAGPVTGLIAGNCPFAGSGESLKQCIELI